VPPVRGGGALDPVPGCTRSPAPPLAVFKAAAFCAAASKTLVSAICSTTKREPQPST